MVRHVGGQVGLSLHRAVHGCMDWPVMALSVDRWPCQSARRPADRQLESIGRSVGRSFSQPARQTANRQAYICRFNRVSRSPKTEKKRSVEQTINSFGLVRCYFAGFACPVAYFFFFFIFQDRFFVLRSYTVGSHVRVAGKSNERLLCSPSSLFATTPVLLSITIPEGSLVWYYPRAELCPSVERLSKHSVD